jgi:hypothetical protein
MRQTALTGIINLFLLCCPTINLFHGNNTTSLGSVDSRYGQTGSLLHSYQLTILATTESNPIAATRLKNGLTPSSTQWITVSHDSVDQEHRWIMAAKDEPSSEEASQYSALSLSAMAFPCAVVDSPSGPFYTRTHHPHISHRCNNLGSPVHSSRTQRSFFKPTKNTYCVQSIGTMRVMASYTLWSLSCT